ncbi:MAG: nicotinate-nucleotide--dimethylbenzimidazole phosphoribosyltransferase [Brachymonas denitrificans]|uniref:nicotinate-nucleotide--dimethylbenzimidazole phosphoribosyltransferase n=1 Tax=Brachymonas denitrificans TaxID=28220 RepID=UPI001BCD3A2E|nr:nicotinate-nucleotide--dimethylbenzimidazole phosphoribosyltransferase [Brachymonas denitrificans]
MRLELDPVLDLENAELRAELQRAIDQKTKPLGSLGALEHLALEIGMIRKSTRPVLEQPQMVVFAGDHGLVKRGVSAFPQDVTWQMVENFLAGGAAVSVLARQHGIALTVVDCGVAHDFAPRPALRVCKVAPGTADCSQGPAMTMEQCLQAIRNGQELVRSLPGNALMLGEMGIGNTSSASLLLARLHGVDLVDCTGAGTGLNSEGVRHKIAVLREALAANPDTGDALDALAALGGFEIATMVGAMLQAAAQDRLLLIDGVIVTSALLVAAKIEPRVLQRCIFSHRSGEPGHQYMLEVLHARPLLDWGMRLGEGSGAAIAWPLLESACTMLRDMASFASAGVDGQSA